MSRGACLACNYGSNDAIDRLNHFCERRRSSRTDLPPRSIIREMSDLLICSRRSFLCASTLGVTGAVARRSARAAPSDAAPPDKACIVFFLDGGPSHLDTFDPKPDAPAEVRGQFVPIDTSVPALRISDQLPLLATQAEHFALIRSLYHSNPSHAPAEHQMLTGWMGSRPGTARAVIENPSFVSIVARLRRARREAIPPYVAIPWSFHHAYGGSPFARHRILARVMSRSEAATRRTRRTATTKFLR